MAYNITKNDFHTIIEIVDYRKINEIVDHITSHKKSLKGLQHNFYPKDEYFIDINSKTYKIKLKPSEYLNALTETYDYIRQFKGQGLDTFLWLVEHTEFIEGYLQGDYLFQLSVRPFMLNEIMSILDQYGGYFSDFNVYIPNSFDIQNEKKTWTKQQDYYLVPKQGFYYPFKVYLTESRIKLWLKEMTEGSDRWITYDQHNKDIYLEIHGKNDFLWVINKAAEDFKDRGLLLKLIKDFKLGNIYTTHYDGYNVHIEHTWSNKHITYSEYIYILTQKGNFPFRSKYFPMNYYNLLENSTFDGEMLTLAPMYYVSLGIKKKDVVAKLQELGVNIFSNRLDSVGIIKPMAKHFYGVPIKTPYYYMTDNIGVHYYPREFKKRIQIKQDSYINHLILNENPSFNPHKAVFKDEIKIKPQDINLPQIKPENISITKDTYKDLFMPLISLDNYTEKNILMTLYPKENHLPQEKEIAKMLYQLIHGAEYKSKEWGSDYQTVWDDFINQKMEEIYEFLIGNRTQVTWNYPLQENQKAHMSEEFNDLFETEETRTYKQEDVGNIDLEEIFGQEELDNTFLEKPKNNGTNENDKIEDINDIFSLF